jgi:GntR family transcriptional regulator
MLRPEKTANETGKGEPASAHPPPSPSPLPLYRQVKQHLMNRVLAREWKPGESLPSEIRLAEEYGLSQGTVRKAIEEMAAEGLVSRKAGRGTFVTSFSGTSRPFRFHRLRSEDGRKIAGDNVEFVHCKDGVTDKRAAVGLGLESDMPLTEVLRLRHLDGRPALVERILLPTQALPGIRDLLDAERPPSIYMLLERAYNHLVTQVEERVRARFPEREEGALLGLSNENPVLEVERVAFSLGGQAVEWRTMVCDSQHIHYSSAAD